MANSSTTDIMDPSLRGTVLAQRRCILLSCVNSTPRESSTVKDILNDGYLACVKSWLDEILNGSIGGVDLLLHLLNNVEKLPVTKQMVTSTKLGKLINAVAKHKICVGTLNENAIKERVEKVKQAWMASVKKMKAAAAAASSISSSSSGDQKSQTNSTKRGLEESNGSPVKVSKKPKTLSNLLMQVSTDKKSTSQEALSEKSEDKDAQIQNSSGKNLSIECVVWL